MKDLTSGNIYKTFIIFAIPLVLAGLLSQGYNIIDTVIAGKLLGSKSLAAIGATVAFITFLSSIFWGYGAGYAIYVAKLFGAGEYERMKNSIYSSYIILIAIMIVSGILCIVFKDPIFMLLKVDRSIYKETSQYYVIYMIGFFAIILSANGLYIMNAMGESSFPFYMSVLSAILNISGNIFSVAVLKAGVVGIAISTLLSSVVVSILYFIKLQNCFDELGVDKCKFEFKLEYIIPSIPYAMPTCFQQCVMYVSSLLVAPIVNMAGSSATAAYIVVMRLYDITAAIYQNSAKTVTNYTAQCAGAKKFGNIKKGVEVGLIQGILFVLPCILACSFFAPKVCGLFFPKGHTGQDILYATDFARVYLPFILLNLINNLFHAVTRGVKATSYLVGSTIIGSISRIVISFILAKNYGIYGVFIGWVTSWFVEAVYALIVYFLGLWKPKEMKALEV